MSIKLVAMGGKIMGEVKLAPGIELGHLRRALVMRRVRAHEGEYVVLATFRPKEEDAAKVEPKKGRPEKGK